MISWEVDPMKSIAEHMVEEQEKIEGTPPRFEEARTQVRRALDRIENCKIPEETIAAVLLSEAMPRVVGCYGPERTAMLLAHLANSFAHPKPQ